MVYLGQSDINFVNRYLQRNLKFRRNNQVFILIEAYWTSWNWNIGTLYPLKDTLKWWFTHLDTICFVILEKVFNGIHVVLQHVLHVLCELFGLYTTAVNQWLPGTRFELVMAMPYVTDSINNLWTTQSNSSQQVKGVRFSGLWDHLFAPCWFITIQFYLYSTHNRCLKTPYSVR